VYSENLFWRQALDLFARTFPETRARWLCDVAARGEYCLSAGVQNRIVSLNAVDHLWNMNFLGDVGIDAFEHDAIYFLYHFRGALWQEVFSALTGIGAGMEDLIIDNLSVGDATLTREVFASLRDAPASLNAAAL
jgi:hypothetical protein